MVDNKDLKMFAAIMVGLFLIMVIVGVIYVAAGYLKSTVCTTTDSTYVWEGGNCLNESGGTEQTIVAITQMEIVEAVIAIALGLLTLIVVITLFKVVIKAAKGFTSGF